MIRHLFKLAWNRKRTNLLVIAEIVASFLVVFAVATTALYFAGSWRRPVGFDRRDVMDVRLRMGGHRFGMARSEEDVAALKRILEEVKGIDGVVAAAGALTVPYGEVTMHCGFEVEGREPQPLCDVVTDDYREVLGLEVVRGRWFEEADSGLGVEPVVIDENLAREAYGDQDPIGRTVRGVFGKESEVRVVGVVREFRKDGELTPRGPFMFGRARVGDPNEDPPQSLVLKLRPGLDASFEEALAKRLHALAPDWSFEIRRMDQMREEYLRAYTIPLVVGGIVAAFLMLMVALGLFGVLWQNVIRRTGEIGLRRAMGAGEADIARQFLGEVAVVTTLGLVVGVVLAAQVPLLGYFDFVRTRVFVAGIAASAALIYLLALTCGVYPGILAARTRPAEALHQE